MRNKFEGEPSIEDDFIVNYQRFLHQTVWDNLHKQNAQAKLCTRQCLAETKMAKRIGREDDRKIRLMPKPFTMILITFARIGMISINENSGSFKAFHEGFDFRKRKNFDMVV